MAVASLAFGDGLPGEYLVSPQWRNLFIFYSPQSNPAFMTEQNYFSLRGVFSLASDAPAQLWEAGAVQPLGLYQSAGLTCLGEAGRTVYSGSFDAADQFVADSAGTSNDNYFIVSSYAVNPWNRLSVGINVNLAYQTNFGTSSLGPGVDLGVSYRLLNHPLLGYHLLGITYQNLLSPNLAMSGSDAYSAQFKGQLHSALLENRIELDCQAGLTDFLAKADEFLTGTRHVEWNAYLQVGGWLLRMFDMKAYLGITDERRVEFWGMAFGLRMPGVNNGRDLSVTYQFRDQIASPLSASHSIYARVDLGRHREETYARTMALTLDLSANELYNRALRLYYGGSYVESFMVFSRILNEFGDFFKNDWVTYYRGSCMEMLDMRDNARQIYQEMTQTYPQSDARPYSEVGLERLHYRNGSHTDVEALFRWLISPVREPATPDSLKAVAAYYMGESYMQQKDYARAIQALGLVPENHPEYAFAQHSLAVAYMQLTKDISRALTCLDNAVSVEPTTPALSEIVARSYLFFGFIFYEQNELARAVSALRRVSATSSFAAEAQLALGWTAVKARQWTDCVSSGRALSSMLTSPMLQSEGGLLESYGLTMLKNYDQALLSAQAARDRLNGFRPPDDDSLDFAERAYAGNRITYDALAQTLSDVSRKGESVNKNRVRDSLLVQQPEMRKPIDDFLRYADQYRRTAFFCRSLPSVKEDLDYLITTVRTHVLQNPDQGSVGKMKDKTQGVDREIEKVKKELEKMKK